MSDLIANLPGQVLATGFFPDQPGKAPSFWQKGKNVRFSRGDVSPLLGDIPVARVVGGARVSGILGKDNGIFVGARDKLLRWTEIVGLEELGDLFDDASRWQLVPWADWVLATNGIDPVQVWKAGGAFVPLEGVDFDSAECVAVWNDFAFAANLVVESDSLATALEWCAAGDVEDWTPTLENSADRRFLNQAVGGIKALKTHQTGVLAASLNTLHVVSFTGDDYWFSVSNPLNGIGAVGKHALTMANQLVYGFGPRGMWRSDMVSYQYIDEGAVRDFVFGEIGLALNSPDEEIALKLADIIAFHDLQQKMVCFYYPPEDTRICAHGVAYNYLEGNWTILDNGRTAADDSGQLPYGVSGDCSGRIYRQSVYGLPAQALGGQLQTQEMRAEAGACFGMMGFGFGPFGGLS